jgi:hypothetical protein
MPRIAVGAEDDAAIGVHDEDYGTGAIHGCPLNGPSAAMKPTRA